jgi:hypothetical protein
MWKFGSVDELLKFALMARIEDVETYFSGFITSVVNIIREGGVINSSENSNNLKQMFINNLNNYMNFLGKNSSNTKNFDNFLQNEKIGIKSVLIEHFKNNANNYFPNRDFDEVLNFVRSI